LRTAVALLLSAVLENPLHRLAVVRSVRGDGVLLWRFPRLLPCAGPATLRARLSLATTCL
jgi:hypothetical protein